MAYKIVFARSALKQLGKLPAAIKQRVANFLPLLQENPRPPQCKKLKGQGNTYRLRFGDYRLIYEITEKTKSVHVLRCLHRREVYKQM